MDDRDDRAERELFKKISAKEIRAVTIAFTAIGAVSLAAGLILMAFNVRSEESNVLIGIFFALFGVFVLLCAAIFHLIMSKKYTYEVYKKRTKKGYYSTFDMEVAFIMQKERQAMSENIKKKLEKADITEEKK